MDESIVFLVNPASANGKTGRAWPRPPQRAAALGLHVEIPDPAISATGLVALTELRRLSGRGAAARAALAGFAVHPVLESPPQAERAGDHVGAIAGELELPRDGVHHLLRGCDARRRDKDEERDVLRRRRG